MRTRDPFEPLVRAASTEGNHAAPAVTLEAIVSGSSPKALLDDGHGVRTVGVGDRIGSALVVEIDQSAVLLSDGTRVELNGATK